MARVAGRVAPQLEQEFRTAAERIRGELAEQAWNDQLHSFVGTHGGRDLDASLLQMASLRLLPATDPRLHATVDAIWKNLSRDGWLFRYQLDDGFGQPVVAFIICTFWMVEALVAIGRTADAKAVMERAHAALSPLGLLSEDYQTSDLSMWGNFPQAYSHVGLIHAAFAASPNWAEVL
jgi:GH15 family glucan-1,4-alpha-glucosidase